MTISRKRLKEIEAIRDEDIDYSDIPETDAAFWADAELRTPPGKEGVYVQLDQDIVTWLKAQGPHYQARINTILRTYMEGHQSPSG